MAEVAAIIPARHASTRFPGKPLALIAGRPLLQHVWEQCRAARKLDRVIVATDDDRIAEACQGFGAEVAMTSAAHQSGTDRVAEVAAFKPSITHVINVQGDEPLVSPALIDQLAGALLSGQARMVTAANPIANAVDFANPNVVKVVLDRDSNALYFSRAPIPHSREAEISGAAQPSPGHTFRHHGIYGYTTELLAEFINWPSSPLETTERLEQLRALEHGETIHVIQTREASIGVDVPEDVARVEALLAGGAAAPHQKYGSSTL